MSGQGSGQKRTALGVAGWSLAAVVATGVGVAALTAIGAGITSSVVEPLSQEQVRERIAQQDATGAANGTTTPAPSEDPAPPTSPSEESAESATEQPPPPPSPTFIEVPGGTLSARCDGDQVVDVTSNPAQGYGVDQDADDDDGEYTVQFESEEDEVEVVLTCSAGVLDHRVEVED